MATRAVSLERPGVRVAVRPLAPVGFVLALLVLSGLIALWPAFVLALAAVATVAVLARFRPAYGFFLAVALFGAEGSLKVLLASGGTPLPLSGEAVGALVLDIALVIAVIGLVVRAGRAGLRAGWRDLGALGRTVALVLVAWLLISFGQATQSPDPVAGMAGFRLTHAYVLALVGGVLLVHRRDAANGALGLGLVALAGIGIYAAFRALFGPVEVERAYALSRGGAGLVYMGPEIRTFGSFSDPTALASFLVPTAVFAFTIAILVPRYRRVGLVAGSAAAAGLLGSQVRTALVALAVGLLAASLVTFWRGASPRVRRLVAALAAIAVLAVPAVGVAAASTPDPRVQARLDVWRASIDALGRDPSGSGIHTGGATIGLLEPRVTAENTYLRVLREQGIVGALFVVAVLGAMAVAVRGLVAPGSELRPTGVAAFAAFSAFAVFAAAGDYFEQPGKVFAWALLGVATSAWPAPRRRRA